MKAPVAVLSLVVFVAACGPEATSPGADPKPARVNRAESTRPAPARPDGDPCAPLRAAIVRYDTAGKPFAFSFEIPDGSVVKLHPGGDRHADVTLDLDGKGGDEYILRIAYNTKVLENPEGLVEVWRKLPMTVKVLEKSLGGRTMYVQRVSMGDFAGFTALFPVPGEPEGGVLRHRRDDEHSEALPGRGGRGPRADDPELRAEPAGRADPAGLTRPRPDPSLLRHDGAEENECRRAPG